MRAPLPVTSPLAARAAPDKTPSPLGKKSLPPSFAKEGGLLRRRFLHPRDLLAASSGLCARARHSREKKKKKRTAAPRIPTWSPTVVLARRYCA